MGTALNPKTPARDRLHFVIAIGLGLIALSLPATAMAQVSSLAGEWRNADLYTRSITRVEIVPSGAGFTLHVFGACHPSDCDWGSVSAHVYANSVSGNSSAVGALTGNYSKPFATTEVVLQFAGEQLRYQIFTHFTDNSRRPDYVSTGLLSRF